MLQPLTTLTLALSHLLTPTHAALDLSYGDDFDLTSYTTRPEIKTPKFNLTIHDASRISPGYWFVAPYAMIFQEKHAKKYYQPCQTGPSIYDNRGDLIWSGACKVKNQNTCDFRAWQFNGSLYTSAILTPFRDVGDPQGHGIITDSSFQNVGEVHVPSTMHNLNMHELNLVDEGKKALHIIHEAIETDLTPVTATADEVANMTSGWILDVGFRELDLITGNVTFEWWAKRGGGVALTESKVPFHHGRVKQQPWNWFHGNAIEKNSDGDFLLSSRFTDTIFKISGKDGSIIWRLGGYKSSFEQDFQFSRQHDARWLPGSEGNIEVLSFLNNAADDFMQDAETSEAMIVELDTATMKARSLSSIPRPDKGLTRMRGNHQVLPNGNSFVCWSENSYMSEHSPNGDLLMEAKFASFRFVTYRAYKFNFTSTPTEPLVVKGFAYGPSASSASSLTVIHASWNGATEVEKWRFRTSEGGLLGEKKRMGFETTFTTSKYHREVYAEAISAQGEVLGHSANNMVVRPDDWEADETSSSGDQKAAASSSGQAKSSIGVPDEFIAIFLLITTVILISVALSMWRCTNGGRSSIRLSNAHAYSPILKNKEDRLP